MGLFVVIYSDGVVIENSPKVVSGRDIKAALDGAWLQVIPYFHRYNGVPCIAFCDEDGRRKEFKENMLATDLWYQQCPAMRARDNLVGTIVIVTLDIFNDR